MDKLQFTFKLLAAIDGKSNRLCVIRITTPEGRTYRVPNEYITYDNHTELLKTPAFLMVKKSLKERGQFRRVWITLNKELQRTYCDADGNLQFENEFLEEVIEKQESIQTVEQPLAELLQKLLEKGEEQAEQKNLGRLAKDFTIEKFDGKNTNADQWLSEFEKECDRFNIIENVKKIEILKSFLEKSAADWYSCTLLKFSIESEWKVWKENFCGTFGSKGWSPIRYAMTFKYQSGSLLEYSIKKEKLLLQVRKSIDNGTLMDLIAIGLPNNVTDRIDRGKLKKTEDLHNEIGKLEHLTYKKNSAAKQNTSNTKGKYEKTPCKVCKDKGKGSRFHLETDCWYKDQNNKLNKPKQVNNLALGVELSDDDQKN